VWPLWVVKKLSPRTDKAHRLSRVSLELVGKLVLHPTPPAMPVLLRAIPRNSFALLAPRQWGLSILCLSSIPEFANSGRIHRMRPRPSRLLCVSAFNAADRANGW
jgi:hypothetical protein